MRKKEMLNHWRGLAANQPLNPQVIPYRHEGSTFAEDSIRLTGSPAFIDAVLSRLKELLAHENGATRLQVSYQESRNRDTGTPTGSYCCYIQVHERGGEAKAINAYIEAVTGRSAVA